MPQLLFSVIIVHLCYFKHSSVWIRSYGVLLVWYFSLYANNSMLTHDKFWLLIFSFLWVSFKSLVLPQVSRPITLCDHDWIFWIAYHRRNSGIFKAIYILRHKYITVCYKLNLHSTTSQTTFSLDTSAIAGVENHWFAMLSKIGADTWHKTSWHQIEGASCLKCCCPAQIETLTCLCFSSIVLDKRSTWEIYWLCLSRCTSSTRSSEPLMLEDCKALYRPFIHTSPAFSNCCLLHSCDFKVSNNSTGIRLEKLCWTWIIHSTNIPGLCTGCSTHAAVLLHLNSAP